MDRFDNMRVFAKVAEIGGFAGAAAQLDISPSMVSQDVNDFEESFWRAPYQRRHVQSV